MTLPAGTRLGPYEIVAPLGAGGMGEVYRARDKKLDRDVAIKVLPQSVAADPDTLARFEREAKAVAALSHQNILAIHDFGDQDGVAYAVMELLEGETLRGKLDAGLIPQKQAVDYALQVAKGLSAAHEKGIVHRDLKPENLFVSRDGHVKILDFGLAKRVETVAPGKETSAPTGSGHTEPGTVMGTAGYMSPEQVKGFPVDHRSDIFAFGVVLYELLSGKKAFQRASGAETMAAILRDDPPELTESGRNISPALDRVVKHCLEKDRDQRFQSARDIVFNLSEQFGPPAASNARESSPPLGAAGSSVAVLPFKYGGSSDDLAALADGLTEAIGTGLSRFRYLSVVASALGARYVLEGSIREGGSALRLTAQLVDTETGARLWAETYNRDLRASSTFEVQDDVAAHIVATVADSFGVLVHALNSASRKKDDARLTPAEWQFAYFAFSEQFTPANHAALKSRLERVIREGDRQSDMWACLAQIYSDEYAFGFSKDATILDRALAAARRAVELDRSSQFALLTLARAHFFRQDLAAFGPAAERAMALNPLNTATLGMLGLMIVHTGEFERGAAIVRRAMELNPNHAGWMHFAPLWEHFHKGEYEQALERANRVDVPGAFWPYLVMASACGHLGRRAEAESAVRDLLALDPEFAAHARSNVGVWHFASGLMDPILEGLRKAGLAVPEAGGSDEPARRGDPVTAGPERVTSGADSGANRAREGFWVAVLPFRSGSGDASLTALAEGLNEDIVTGLSRFTYLKVIARSVTSRNAAEAPDVHAAAAELGARYVMEGSLRQAGGKLRFAVQLVDAISGAHLWAENYERSFRPEAMFELQDELVPRIVSSVADAHGVLPHSMSEGLRSRPQDALSPYEAVLRSFGYGYRITPEEHAIVRAGLERAVQEAPGYSDAWAMLSLLYGEEYSQGFNPQPDPLGRALHAAQRAADAAPSSALAFNALARSYFFRREFQAFRTAAERAIELNPLNGPTLAGLGSMMAYAGDWEHGCALVERATQLNPRHPGWYWMALVMNAYRKGDYRGAIQLGLKVNLPEFSGTHEVMAAAYGQAGERDAAERALRELLRLKPDYATSPREKLQRFVSPELVEHVMDGLRKAGLAIPASSGSSDSPERSGTVTAKAERADSVTASGATRADEGFWVAVMPFTYGGAEPSLAALAEGLTDELVTGLSRFSYLRVIARHAAPAGRSRTDLGARYVLEGSLRQAGGRLRVAVQLVDTASGAHVWSETYDRAFVPDEIFSLQDELVPRIVSTVADMHGVLPRSMSEVVRLKAADRMSPYEAVLRSFGYNERFTPEDLAEVLICLEAAVQQAPANAECWAMLSVMCANQYGHWDNAAPDSLDRSLRAARKAVEAAPLHSLPYYALAQALFFKREFPAFRVAAERAVSLNPMDGATAAFMGLLIAYAGDWERGCALSKRGSELNPNHPGWYRYTAWHDAYRKKDYRQALDVALHLNAPQNYYTHAVLAMCYAQLGRTEEARKALRDMLALKPNYAEVARELHGRWIDPDLVEQLIDGLRKAGLEIGDKAGAPAALKASDFGSVHTDEGFWVAVLPFKYGGADASLTALAEGLTEDIVTGLSRFSYLRVIARGSTLRYTDQATDARVVGKELGARYVMEGSLRQAGAKLRLAVQLVDAVSGAHLWAENYERSFSLEAVFELQDELVPRIVSTVADMHGVLPRSMSEAVRGRAPGQLSPYEAMVRSFAYFERVTPEELAAARSGLEQAVEKAPDHPDGWAMLALLCVQDYAQGFELQKDSLSRGLAAARRAVEAAPTNHLAHFALAQALFFQKEFQSFRNAAERSLALNPCDGNSIAFLGELLTYAGDRERGLALAERAKRLNPHHPGWYWYVDAFNAYRQGDDRAAIDFVLKANLPGHWGSHAALAAAYGQLGERDGAGKALKELLKLRPDFGVRARSEAEKWWDPEYVERWIDGLRKAGLEGALPSQSEPAERLPTAIAIAVLPFSDMSPAKDQEYLCEGMAEEIMNALVRIEGIRVASRTSAFRARRDGGDLPAIARALSVSHVLEGSVRAAGDRLRVTAQLTDAASGFQLWSERFDRKAEDVFAVQDEIAAGVVEAVKARLSPGEHAVSVRPRSTNLEAYRSYLKGRHLRGKEDLAGALGAFEESIRLDPSYAPSWTGLAEITVLASVFGVIPARQACETARNALAKAKQLQGESADGLHVEAFVAWIERRWADMETAWRRAIELQPTHVQALASFGIVLCSRQRLDEALPFFERARQSDPLASFPYSLTGNSLLGCGRPQEALRYLEDALSFEKEDATALDSAGMAKVVLGRLDEGIAMLEHVVAISHRGPHFLGTLGWALATAGRTAEARTILEELRARPPSAPPVVSEAWLLGALGEIDAAFDVVARAEEECQAYVYFTGLPGFDPLRGDPRFAALLARLELPPA